MVNAWLTSRARLRGTHGMANQFVAYQDDRHGLGAWVASRVAETAFADVGGMDVGGMARGADAASPDGGVGYASARSGGVFSGPTFSGGRPEAGRRRSDPRTLSSAYKAHVSPRQGASDVAATVVSGQARFGVLPLMDDGGLNAETLAALIDFPAAAPAREFVASSNFVLAVPAVAVHEIEQAGFTDSFQSNGQASFQWNEKKQRKYLGRVGRVLASGDAMRLCRPAIDGLRARGVEVVHVPDDADSYREGLRIANAGLDPNRAVETAYDGTAQTRVSRTRGANHAKGLTAVLLTADRAWGPQGYDYDEDYLLLDVDMAGADPVRTAFVAVAKAGGPRAKDTARDAMLAIRAALDSDPRSLPGRGGADHRASRADFVLPGDAGARSGRDIDGRGGGAGASDLARVLWSVPTTGAASPKGRVSDYSPVIGMLTRAGLPHKVAQLSGRPGNPVVIAFDVPRAKAGRAKKIVERLARMHGARRLGAFPATEALVDPALMPRGEDGAGAIRAASLVVGVLGMLGLFLAWRWFTA